MELETNIKEILGSYAHPCGLCPANKTESEAKDCNECMTVHVKAILAAIRSAGYVKLAEDQNRMVIEGEDFNEDDCPKYHDGVQATIDSFLTPVDRGNGKQTRWVKIIEDNQEQK